MIDVYKIRVLKLSILFAYRRIRSHFTKRKNTVIQIVCGFHGRTGGAIAIASIANFLSKYYSVEFVCHRSSNFNQTLSHNVLVVSTASEHADIYIVDLSCSIDTLEFIKMGGKPIIATVHGMPDKANGLEFEHIQSVINLVDKVHFVGDVQVEAFGIPLANYTLIPNFVEQVYKTKRTENVGMVGNMDIPDKQLGLALTSSVASKAKHVHIWSSQKKREDNTKIVTHGWESNKTKIYNSFDVLVSLSKHETFGLTVVEAMSAGIPCVLSDIAAFQQFRDCPGVSLVQPENTVSTTKEINHFLIMKDKLSEDIREYYRKHYSPEVISGEWRKLISITILNKLKGNAKGD